jgi:hypothetical protein
MSTQEMLEEAITLYGVSDIVTKMLSQKRDIEIVEEQKKLYKTYKEDLNNGRICTSFN